MSEFKYDQTDIHLTYDKARHLPAETIHAWMQALSTYIDKSAIHTVLDVGCGTGRFTKALSSHFSARAIGLDLSQKMLAAARQTVTSPSTQLIQGSADSIPLRNRQADMAFLSMVYHHLSDKTAACTELARVLRSKGFLCIRTATIESLDTYDWVQFFPGARRIEAARMPSRPGLATTMETCGIELAGHTVVQHRFAENLRKYYEKIALRGISSLKAISDKAFETGLVDFEKYCRENETGKAVYEAVDLFVFRTL